jgi:hypothetical protein
VVFVKTVVLVMVVVLSIRTVYVILEWMASPSGQALIALYEHVLTISLGSEMWLMRTIYIHGLNVRTEALVTERPVFVHVFLDMTVSHVSVSHVPITAMIGEHVGQRSTWL